VWRDKSHKALVFLMDFQTLHIVYIKEGPLTKNGPIDFAQSSANEKIQLDLWRGEKGG